MGIDSNALRFLLEARICGIDYSQTITIGRQNYYRLTPAIMHDRLRAAGINTSSEEVTTLFSSDGAYADGLMRYLGARVLHSVDYSCYEHASHIFDMNLPAPAELEGKYTAVIDGGTLEHVFNFPQAIANCMNMVCVGGHFLAFTPANNFFGHGFYQFSAELFFRIFEPSNGFEIERMLLVEDDQNGRGWFEVADPAAAQERVTLMSATPSQLFVLARKVEHTRPFKSPPYQSDYVATWTARKGKSRPTRRYSIGISGIRNSLKALIPSNAKEWLRSSLFPGPRSRPDLFRRLP